MAKSDTSQTAISALNDAQHNAYMLTLQCIKDMYPTLGLGDIALPATNDPHLLNLIARAVKLCDEHPKHIIARRFLEDDMKQVMAGYPEIQGKHGDASAGKIASGIISAVNAALSESREEGWVR